MNCAKMRVLWFNLCLLLGIVATYSGVQSQDIKRKNDIPLDGRGAIVSRFLDDHSSEVLQMMKDHFDMSLKYMYTSHKYNSQDIQRPGMGKFLKEQSQNQWDDGLELLKKYMQRGGSSYYLDRGFKFSGVSNVAADLYNADMGFTYLGTIKDTLKDSKHRAVNYNALHRMSERRTEDKITPHHDADWGHYFQEKLENEAGRTRALAGHETTLAKMVESGMALHFFDANM